MDITADPRESIYAHLVTPRVRVLTRRELAESAVRRELIAAGANRRIDDLSGLLPLARTLGVTVAEAQRLTGFARQSLYTVLNAEPAESFRERDVERLARLLNIAIVAAGEQTLAQIAAAINVRPAALGASARLLAKHELGRFSPSGRDPGKAILAPTELSSEWLRLHASSCELDQRAPGYSVYLRVTPEDVRRIDAVLDDVVGLDEAAVLPATTAPSVMEGPELAITIRATDQRAALRGAEAIWREIGSRVGGLAPMQVADLRPPVTAPNAPSAVLDTFVGSFVEGFEEETGNRIRGERERYDGGEAERVLAGRCLTMAARELRRELGREDADRAPTINNGDAAFDEWQIVQSPGLGSLSKRSSKIRRPLLAALELAARRLGPFRGGELAAFKAPGERPSETREVAPSEEDLVEMARLCGEAIAAGGGDDRHLLEVIRAVLDGAGQ